jgi:hypothetical protein
MIHTLKITYQSSNQWRGECGSHLSAAAAVWNTGALAGKASAGALDARNALGDTVDDNVLREALRRDDGRGCDGDSSEYGDKKCRELHLDGNDLLVEFVCEL